MSMFSRMTDIVQANINAMLDKAEDPEKVVRLIIQEMEETLVEIRSEAAKFIAEQKHLSRQLEKCEKEAANWQEKAQLAVDKDKDELARAALAEKQRYTQKAEGKEFTRVGNVRSDGQLFRDSDMPYWLNLGSQLWHTDG